MAQHILDQPSLEVYKLNNRSGYLLNENSASWAHYLYVILDRIVPFAIVTNNTRIRADVGLQAAASLPQYVRDNRGQIVEGQHRNAFQMAFDSESSRQSSRLSEGRSTKMAS